MIPDKNKLFADLDALGEQAVRERLAQGVYAGKPKLDLIQEWLRKCEASRSEEILLRQEERELAANKIASSTLNEARSANSIARSAKKYSFIAIIITVIFSIINIILIIWSPKR